MKWWNSLELIRQINLTSLYYLTTINNLNKKQIKILFNKLKKKNEL